MRTSPSFGCHLQMGSAQRAFHAVVVATLLVLLCTAAGLASAAPSSRPFRCLRPFSAMDSFVAVAKADATDNCMFHYFTVTAAAAELRCATTADRGTPPLSSQAGEKAAATSCNVTVRWSMRRADDVAAVLRRQIGTDADYFAANTAERSASSARTAQHSPQQQQQKKRSRAPTELFLTEDEDVWRYAVSLCAKGDSTVQYKGYNGGDGYSMCCDGIVEGECAWMAAEQGDNDLAADEEVNPDFALQHRRMLRGCPLPFPATMPPTAAAEEADDNEADGAFGAAPGARVALTDLDEEDAAEGREEGVFHGQITKPLHRLVEGPWEVTLQMWRRRQRRPTHAAATPSSSSVPTDSSAEAEVLGRVVVPFTVHLAELQREGRVRHVDSMALALEEDVVEVAPAPAPPSSVDAGEAEDTGDL